MKIGFKKEQIIMLFSANFPFLSRWMVDLHDTKKSGRRIVFHSQSGTSSKLSFSTLVTKAIISQVLL